MSVLKIRNIVLGEGIPKIIVPLVEKSEQKLMNECERVSALGPDMIEWRVDMFENVENPDSIQKLLQLMRQKIGDIPLLFTFRTITEGGNKEISPMYYKELLQLAIHSELVDLVDVELSVGENLFQDLLSIAKEKRVSVVMSNHDFHQTPSKEEIITRLHTMQALGAAIPKIAVMANSTEDVITLLEASQEMKNKIADRPFIAISMGKYGLTSRFTGEVFGSAATFASGQNESAPGQIPISEIRQLLATIHKHSK